MDAQATFAIGAWDALAPAIDSAMLVTPVPAVATWTAVAPSVALEAAAMPAVLAWDAQSPATALALSASTTGTIWTCLGPATDLEATTAVVDMTFTAAPPTFAMGVQPGVLAAGWFAATPGTEIETAGTPPSAAWTAAEARGLTYAHAISAAALWQGGGSATFTFTQNAVSLTLAWDAGTPTIRLFDPVPSVSGLDSCAVECGWAFGRLQARTTIRHGTWVEWVLHPGFDDKGVYRYQLQVGTTGSNAADDWVNVGLPASNVSQLVDDTPRAYGKTQQTHYRVCLTTLEGVYISEPVSTWGNLPQKHWRLLLNRERIWERQVQTTLRGRRGYLLKRKVVGEQPEAGEGTLDWMTEELINPQDPETVGTEFIGGYYAPIGCVYADLDPLARREHLDKSRGTVNDDTKVKAVMLARPQLDSRDVWVDEATDTRWEIHGIQHVEEVSGTPVLVGAEFRLLPFSHPVYEIEIERPEVKLPVQTGSASRLRTCPTSCDPVFNRVHVRPTFRHGTLVEWQLDRHFSDTGTYQYQLQVGHTGTSLADDWENVGLPASNTASLVDDTQRDYGKTPFAHYRVCLTTGQGTYTSEPVSVWGDLPKKYWRRLLNRERIWERQVLATHRGQQGYLLKRKLTGDQPELGAGTLDWMTEEVVNPQDAETVGTAFIGGYYDPIECVYADLDPQTRREHLDEGKGRGTINDKIRTKAVMLARPQVDSRDVWVDLDTDMRWEIHSIQHIEEVGGVPVIIAAEFRLLPFSHPVYEIEITRPEARTEVIVAGGDRTYTDCGVPCQADSGECLQVFGRVQVRPTFANGTWVEWQVNPHFTDTGTYQFQLQVGHTGSNRADDWTNVGLPANNVAALVDDTQRVHGKTQWTHYRVYLTTGQGTYASEPVGCWGNLPFRHWRMVKNRERQWRKQFERTIEGQLGYLLKRRLVGEIPEPEEFVTDYLTGEVINPQAPSTRGTEFAGGYYAPIPCTYADLGTPTRREHLDKLGTTNEGFKIQARMLATPQADSYDIWVDKDSDFRWEIHEIQHLEEYLGVPVAINAEFRLLPFTHPAYEIPILGQAVST